MTNMGGFQARVASWMLQCFTPEIAEDRLERNDRFIEEALELVQATGYSRERAHALVDYVFDRKKGDPDQEVGGVMVTLAALCQPNGLDMVGAGERELARILSPEIIGKIRAKQATKPTGSALPIPVQRDKLSATSPSLANIVTEIDELYERAHTGYWTTGELSGDIWKNIPPRKRIAENTNLFDARLIAILVNNWPAIRTALVESGGA